MKRSTGNRRGTGSRGGRGKILCILCVLCFLCLARQARAQAPATTTVRDTIYRSDGTLASGSVVISWSPFLTADAKPVFGGTKTVTLSSGALAVALAPNAGGTPSGTSYSVKYYQSGGVFSEETWVVPASSPLANPAQVVSVTQAGTPGSTTYYYWCTATNASGETLLSPSRITTTSHATLDVTNYNIITCPTVSGATGYKVYRTTTATAPSGTGNFLVGSSATTVINDQSNTLSSAAIPALNTTDPKTLADVRVVAAPSPAVTVTASQVIGTAIVASPAATQAITVPSTSGVVPLQLKGNATAAADVLDIFDSQATPVKQSFFGSGAAFNTAKQIISTLATGTAPFSVASTTEVANLRAATASALAANGANCAGNNFAVGVDAAGAGECAQPDFSNLSGAASLAQLPVGAANQILGTNAGATAQEHKTLATGTGGTDFAIAHAAGSITLNLPDASASARGAVTTGAQSFGGVKTFVAMVGTQVAVGFSATPTFDADAGNSFKITLTGNATNSTLSNADAGQVVSFLICQDGTGSHTFAWPANVKGAVTVGSTLNTCTAQDFLYDGTNAYALSAGVTGM